MAPLVAGISVILWNLLQTKFKIPTKTLLIYQLAFYMLLPLYTCFGFFAPFGLAQKSELWPFVTLAMIGFAGLQSTCRSLFAEIVPPGKEAEFTSLFSIMDKNSAFISPLICGIIGNHVDMRWSYVFLFVAFIFPLYLFTRIDVKQAIEQGSRYSKMERALDLETRRRMHEMGIVDVDDIIQTSAVSNLSNDKHLL